jgi:hypothetical protein
MALDAGLRRHDGAPEALRRGYPPLTGIFEGKKSDSPRRHGSTLLTTGSGHEGFRRVRFAHRSVSEYLPQRREGSKVTGDARHPEGTRTSRNDKNSKLGVPSTSLRTCFAPWQKEYPNSTVFESRQQFA